MQDCWAISDSRAAFTQALKERGFILAKGDRRGHIAVTPEGEALSVARYVGKKAKEIRARLGEPDGLPSVAQAQAQASRDMAGMVNRVIGEARQQHAQGMAPLEARRRVMTQSHRRERVAIKHAQKVRSEVEARARAGRLRSGLKGILDRLTGRRARIERQTLTEALAALKRDERQRADLRAAQMAERRSLQQEIQRRRSTHAALLRELRADRLAQLAQLQELEPAVPTISGRNSNAKESNPLSLTREFRSRASATCPALVVTAQDRLRRHQSPQGRQRQNGVDRER